MRHLDAAPGNTAQTAGDEQTAAAASVPLEAEGGKLPGSSRGGTPEATGEQTAAAAAADPDNHLDQGIGEIHHQRSAESPPSEASVPASAPASSTTTPEASEEDAE